MSLVQATGLISLPLIGSKLTDYLFSTRVNEIDEWYHSRLVKPKLCPPNWIFPFIWTGLYPSMGYASYLILRDSSGLNRRIALSLYGSQLVLNWAWSPIFFKKHKIRLSSFTIGLLTFNVVGCIYKFREINKTAAYLMLPYLFWLTFSTYLNVGFWIKNRN